jgi:segregation and condensation protein A
LCSGATTALASDPAEGEAEPNVPDWEAPSRSPPASAAPVLAVDGFEGPLDWLLDLARAQRIDLARLSILALIEAFSGALDTALARPSGTRPDLARWGEWLVMAASLALLRSRLLLPADAPGSKAAQDEAEALRQVLVSRRTMQHAAEWLDRQVQLGRDVFPRGRAGETADERGRAGDVTDLFRACLVALRVPEQAGTYQLRLPVWRVTDAVARITLLLEARPGGGALVSFLPRIDADGPERALRCRAALASTFLGGLELARAGALTLDQPATWDAIQIHAPAGTENRNIPGL